MSRPSILSSFFLGAALLCLSAGVVRADNAPIKPKSLDQLLQQVRKGWHEQNAGMKRREKEFRAAKNRQRALLDQMIARREKSEQRGTELEQTFEQNELRLAELEELLQRNIGDLGELFGVVRQVAGETLSDLTESVITAQFPDRAKSLPAMAESKSIPSIKELEEMWYLLQQEITESGKVSQFKAAVTDLKGIEGVRQVTRVGAFNTVADGKYLIWMGDDGRLTELGRQPPGRFLSTASALEGAKEGLVRFALDPSRGRILSLLVKTPNFWERIQFGGIIGYIIIFLGIVAVLVGFLRFIVLSVVGAKVRAQQGKATPSTGNPLGRIMKVYADNPDLEVEALDLKLEESIIREQARLDRFLWAIKVVSVVAPLMGLLGTVTGMIRTFQAITLYGTGDPQLMAGGISEALVTTMLGLIVAIPLVLLHSSLRSLTRHVMDVLGEQSTGIVAMHAEKVRHAHSRG